MPLRITYSKGELVNGNVFLEDRVAHGPKRTALFLCANCGKEFEGLIHYVKFEPNGGCGCRKHSPTRFKNPTWINPGRTSHGLSKGREYAIWRAMKRRCSKPTAPEYKYYGQLGVKVCERWMKFENFYNDMGARPGREYSIDRINPYGDYEPSNCRWATWKQQANNQRRHHPDLAISN